MALDIRAVRSQRPANAKIHDASWFPGAFNPIPSNEEAGLSPEQMMDRIAPEDGPRIALDKHRSPYVVPCMLKVAPYVGKTAEKYPGQSGKQRSAAHVTAGSWFGFDIDDIAWTDQARIVGRLERAKLMFCAFSTWSHGKTDQVRMRVLLFMDSALPPVKWRDCWEVVNRSFLDGLADPATGKLSQQMGIWSAHPERISKAFRIARPGALLSADELLATIPPKIETPKPRNRQLSNSAQVRRYSEALGLIGSDDYASWMVGLKGLKGAVIGGDLSDDDAAALWFVFSDAASDEAKARNHDARFDPESLWLDWMPTVAPPAALIGVLMAKARDAALGLVRTDIDAGGELSPEGLQAARYLSRWHRRAFDDLTNGVQA